MGKVSDGRGVLGQILRFFSLGRDFYLINLGKKVEGEGVKNVNGRGVILLTPLLPTYVVNIWRMNCAELLLNYSSNVFIRV